MTLDDKQDLTSLGSEKSTSGGGGAGARSLAGCHHGCSCSSSGGAPPATAGDMAIGSSGGGPMLLNIRTMPMLSPSITAKMIPPTIPALKAALAPPREASAAPVQKPDICSHRTPVMKSPPQTVSRHSMVQSRHGKRKSPRLAKEAHGARQGRIGTDY